MFHEFLLAVGVYSGRIPQKVFPTSDSEALTSVPLHKGRQELTVLIYRHRTPALLCFKANGNDK